MRYNLLCIDISMMYTARIKVVMQLKWKCLIGALCVIMFCTSVKAYNNADTYIVDLKSSVSLFSEESAERKSCVVTREELDELLEMGIVEYYEPNHKVELLGESWNLDAIEVDFAREMGCYGNEVTVAVIDSGLYPFEELEGNVIAGKNYLSGTEDTTDNIGHGTFVTGLIASESKGVSYKCKIVPLKCFDANEDTYVSDLLDAIYDAVDVYNCDVINMSWGFTSSSEKLERAITYAVNNGVIVTAAVGNSGNKTIYYPAAYNNVVGVGSVNQENEKSYFSQYNTSVFVTAPGEGLESLSITGYRNTSGTSFAAPHVTALAAIAKCIDGNITASEFKDLLSKSSTDLGAEGYDVYYGHGLINCKEFIKLMILKEDVFAFPVNIENDNACAVIYNNSDEYKLLRCVCAEYENNIFYGCKVLTVVIPPGQAYKLQTEYSDKNFKYMVWQDMTAQKPLTKYRELRKT